MNQITQINIIKDIAFTLITDVLVHKTIVVFFSD